MVITAVLFLIAAVGQAFPLGVADLMFWRFIGGAGIGIASVIAPMLHRGDRARAVARTAPAPCSNSPSSGYLHDGRDQLLILNAASADNPTTSANNTWLLGLEAWQWMFLVMSCAGSCTDCLR